jgi:hypothetical protein
VTPRATDQRQACTIARAIVDRLMAVGGIALADEGEALLAAPSIDWAALLTWNRRACDYLIERNKR